MRQFLRYIIGLLGILLISLSFVQIVQWQLAIQGTENVQASHSGVIRTKISRPSEKDPEEGSFQVKSSSPRKIILPSLNQEGLIQTVGLTTDQEISVPTNIHVAGWFNGSAKPGQKGASVITGHVRGRYRDGIFHNLDTLRPGDTIQIEYGDGSSESFVIKKKQTLSVDKAINDLLRQDADTTSQLHLVTCTGNYQEDIDTYEERLLIKAHPISNEQK